MARPYAKLRGLMREYDYRQEDLAKTLGVDARMLNRKINLTGSCWTIDEMYSIMDRFGVPHEQMHELFPKGGQNENEPEQAAV